MTRPLLAAALVASIIALQFIPPPTDKVVFLDVGQGDAILLQSGTQQVLIDGGPGSTVLQRLSEELPTLDRTLDVLILTHPQRDHIEGLLHVLERYDVSLVLLPNTSHTSQLQDTWLSLIRDRNIPYRFAWTGQHLTIGSLKLSILGPLDTLAARAATKSDINNASTITRADFCPQKSARHNPPGDGRSCLSFLLTGDAEKRVEAMLVSHYTPTLSPPPSTPVDESSPTMSGGTDRTGSSAESERASAQVRAASIHSSELVPNVASEIGGRGPLVGGSAATGLAGQPDHSLLDVDILKAGHHGSNSSTHQPLIDIATPKAAIITVGRDNQFGHPHPAVLERLQSISIFRTDQQGSIAFVYGKTGWALRKNDSTRNVVD